MIPRTLALPLAATALAACAYHPVHEGPPRPRAEVARLGTVPVLRTFTATSPPEILLEELDGRALPAGCERIEIEPGPHVLVAHAAGPGTALGTLVRRELRFEARAGASYWVVYDQSDRDLAGILRIEDAGTREVLAHTTTPLAQLPFAPLPAAADGWLPVAAYLDPGAYGTQTRSMGLVPPHESARAWTRRLELATYGTERERPPLDAVAIDLERCLRSRFPRVAWRSISSGEGVSVQRWTASGPDPAEALEGLTVLRAGPWRAWVATFAARGEGLHEAEIEAWTATLSSLQPHPLQEVGP